MITEKNRQKKTVKMNSSEMVSILMVSGIIIWLSMPIKHSSAQLFGDGETPSCWAKIEDCQAENVRKNETDPRFDPKSSKFNIGELYCCSLVKKTAESQKECFCEANSAIGKDPSIGANFTLLLGACKVADSVSSLDAFCKGQFLICLPPISFIFSCLVLQ